jgi:hypothetical protein
VDAGFLTLALATVGLTALAAILGGRDRTNPQRQPRARRATGNALLGLQQFLQPSVEWVFQAQNVEQKDEDDDAGEGDDEEAILSDLGQALRRTPIDPEELREHLTAALRAGLDWNALFEQAVAAELRERPFRAPYMPPSWRVAPIE